MPTMASGLGLASRAAGMALGLALGLALASASAASLRQFEKSRTSSEMTALARARFAPTMALGLVIIRPTSHAARMHPILLPRSFQ